MLDQALEHHGHGRLKEAEQLYRQILASDPGNADCLHLLGMVAFQSGDSETAASMIREAIAANPNAASYHSNLGNVLQQQGYLRDAAASYLQALRIKPNLAEAQVNLANIFLAASEPEQAIVWYQSAIALNPNLPEAHKNLGDAFQQQKKLELAADSYRHALTLKPDYVDAMSELGGILRGNGELDEALLHLREAQRIQPNHPTAIFREAMILLLQGQFAAGWQCYQGRWESTDHATPMRDYPQPFWQGEAIAEGTVLLWPEQGVGDEIMFAGMLPDAIRTGNRFVLECDARLVSLFQRSFPQIDVTSDREAALDPARHIVAQLPIGSLPFLFRNDRDSFQSGISPYLKADPKKAADLRASYGDDRLRVGLAWHSNNLKTGRNRSMELENLSPLFSLSGLRWISLQYGAQKDLETEIAAAQSPVFVDPAVDQLSSIDDFAAQVAALDLVITIDNTTAHLAGALGVPVWVLLPFASDWRWLASGDSNLWYPSMRLFRQPQRGDWEPVVLRVREALSEL